VVDGERSAFDVGERVDEHELFFDDEPPVLVDAIERGDVIRKATVRE